MGGTTKIGTQNLRNVTSDAAAAGAYERNGLVPGEPVVWNRGQDYFYQHDPNPTSENPPKEFSDPELSARMKKKEEEEDKAKGERPPPTTANPPPPELIPDTKEAIAVCRSPDICRSPTKEVPYQAWARADDDRNYAASVRSNGDIVKHRQSRIHRTRGDEAGVGLGRRSNTVEDEVKPVTSSPVVRATGNPVQRDGDRCTLNRGNTDGEYVHHCSDLTHPAPDGQDEQDKRPWYKRLDDWAGEKLNSAGKAINEFDQNNFKVVTRGVGLLQAAGGLGEMAVGGGMMGLGGAASTTGVGAVPGVPAIIGGGVLFGSGLDNGGTGLKQLWTGETQTTVTARAAGAAATAMGATPETAQTVENVAGVVQGAAGGGAGAVAAGSRLTRAVESGAVGARSTRVLSNRLRYLGRNPSKYERTGKAVRDRMRREGNLRTDPQTGKDVFKADDGNWYPVDSQQTHMGHHPVDAVDYWNETGRFHGAKSPEVRDWMLDSNNYRFEYGPENSARGGATGSRYLPPP